MYRWILVGCAGVLLATGGVATYAIPPESCYGTIIFKMMMILPQ